MFIKLADKGIQYLGNMGIVSCDFVGNGVMALYESPIKLAVAGAVASTPLTYSFLDEWIFPPTVEVPTSTRPVLQVIPVIIPPQDVVRPITSAVTNLSPTLQQALTLEITDRVGMSDTQIEEFAAIVKYEGSTPFKEAIQSMAVKSQFKFFQLAKDYKRMTGRNMRITSAWRSVEKQRGLHKTMPAGLAASACSSAHAIGAMDIDRRGMGSRQVDDMKKLGLLSKNGLWNPPEVGEPWHIEDPDTVYFRYLERKNPDRGIYRKYVCDGLTGKQHDVARRVDGTFTIPDTHRRTQALITTLLANRGLEGESAEVYRQYLLFSLRAESLYGKHMVSKTGALGFWQFTGPVAKQYKLKYPMQLRESARATLDLAIDNSRVLIANGMAVTVENLYYAHMIGGRGNKLVTDIAKGEVVSAEDEKTVDRVVSVNLPKDVRSSLYDDKGERLPTVSVQMAVTQYHGVFTKRFEEYASDVAYLENLTTS